MNVAPKIEGIESVLEQMWLELLRRADALTFRVRNPVRRIMDYAHRQACWLSYDGAANALSMLEERGWVQLGHDEDDVWADLQIEAISAEMRERLKLDSMLGTYAAGPEELITRPQPLHELSIERLNLVRLEMLTSMLRYSFSRALDGYVPLGMAWQICDRVLKRRNTSTSHPLEDLAKAGYGQTVKVGTQAFFLPDLSQSLLPREEDEATNVEDGKGSAKVLEYFSLEQSMSDKFALRGKREKSLPEWHPHHDWNVRTPPPLPRVSAHPPITAPVRRERRKKSAARVTRTPLRAMRKAAAATSTADEANPLHVTPHARSPLKKKMRAQQSAPSTPAAVPGIKKYFKQDYRQGLPSINFAYQLSSADQDCLDALVRLSERVQGRTVIGFQLVLYVTLERHGLSKADLRETLRRLIGAGLLRQEGRGLDVLPAAKIFLEQGVL